ncbi:SDR family NAD(P)-dependent oxidoreductase [Actinomadura viridis]|uniref:SDR family NAD(P)-dependent oxidoreductase n=1 Tax=Actinomadura viridis TaxID=58110 RepID=UPI00369540A9
MTSQPGTQRTWIITGASAGFGRAIAECAVGRRDNVVLAVRRPRSVADLADAHRDQVLVAEFDVRDTGRAGDLVRSAVDRFGRVDVLVNNAGRGVVGAAEKVGEEELRASLELHLLGPAALVRAVLPDARWLFPGRRAGQPLNNGTMLQQLCDHGFSPQAARTAALRQLVLQAPAPVIARSLGFHDTTTARIAAEAGKSWIHYAPGDHTR